MVAPGHLESPVFIEAMGSFVSLRMNEMDRRTSDMNAFIEVNYALISEMIALISKVIVFISDSLAR